MSFESRFTINYSIFLSIHFIEYDKFLKFENNPHRYFVLWDTEIYGKRGNQLNNSVIKAIIGNILFSFLILMIACETSLRIEPSDLFIISEISEYSRS